MEQRAGYQNRSQYDSQKKKNKRTALIFKSVIQENFVDMRKPTECSPGKFTWNDRGQDLYY